MFRTLIRSLRQPSIYKATPSVRCLASTPVFRFPETSEQSTSQTQAPLSTPSTESKKLKSKPIVEPRTRHNTHTLEEFLTLIGRNCIEHSDVFEGSLEKFLKTSSLEMKEAGIETRTRRYLLRWRHKFVNDLEPLREHKRGKKRNGGERKQKAVLGVRRAKKKLEERNEYNRLEAEAEARGERVF